MASRPDAVVACVVGHFLVRQYGLDLSVASWLVGMGIFLASSRFVEKVHPDAHGTEKSVKESVN